MSNQTTIHHVKNKNTGIVHTVVAGHWSLSDDNYELVEPLPTKKRRSSKRKLKNGT